MISDFPCYRQRGTYDCLLTALQAVLEWHQIAFTPSELLQWCHAQVGGCYWPDALRGLVEAGFDLQELETEEDVARFVEDLELPLPVVVTVIQDARQSGADHAVVVVGVSHQFVSFMDPTMGEIRTLSKDHFWAGWDLAGGRAFVILG